MKRSLKIDYQNHAQIPKHKTIAKPAESRQNPLKQSTMLLVYYVCLPYFIPNKLYFYIMYSAAKRAFGEYGKLYIIYIMRLLII